MKMQYENEKLFSGVSILQRYYNKPMPEDKPMYDLLSLEKQDFDLKVSKINDLVEFIINLGGLIYGKFAIQFLLKKDHLKTSKFQPGTECIDVWVPNHGKRFVDSLVQRPGVVLKYSPTDRYQEFTAIWDNFSINLKVTLGDKPLLAFDAYKAMYVGNSQSDVRDRFINPIDQTDCFSSACRSVFTLTDEFIFELLDSRERENAIQNELLKEIVFWQSLGYNINVTKNKYSSLKKFPLEFDGSIAIGSIVRDSFFKNLASQYYFEYQWHKISKSVPTVNLTKYFWQGFDIIKPRLYMLTLMMNIPNLLIKDKNFYIVSNNCSASPIAGHQCACKTLWVRINLSQITNTLNWMSLAIGLISAYRRQYSVGHKI